MTFPQKHILVVEDNESVREVIVLMLEEGGYRATGAQDGLSMRTTLQRSDPVDGIILDALMPGEGSATLARHARDLNLPVVMISGSHDRIVFAEDNGLQLLRKPFLMVDLIQAVEDALASGQFGQRDA